MYLTLYKRCILSKDYTEVFDCTHRVQSSTNYSFFTRYLNSLNQRTYEIENVFITNEGSFNIPLEIANEDNIYEYNYMRLSYTNVNEHLLKTTRYCFIDNIEIRNDIAVISYTTDVWHTFSAYMYIRNSYLSRSRMLDFYNVDEEHIVLSPFKLPTEYDGVNPLIINSLFKTPSQSNQYNIVLELQKYTTTTEGNESKRNVEYVMIQKRTSIYNASTTSWDTSYLVDLTMNEVIEMINTLTEKQGAKNLKSFYKYGIDFDQVTPIDAFYNIGNIYVIPKEYNVNTLFDNTEVVLANGGIDYIEIYKDSEQNPTKYLLCVFCKAKDTIKYKETLIKQDTITNDFKYLYIGHLTEQFDFLSNGTTRLINIYSFITEYDFKLFLYVDNKIIDITQNYYVEVPFSSIDGNENSQKKMSRELGNIQNVLKLGTDVVSLINGGSLFKSGTSTINSISKNNYSRVDRQLTSSFKTSTRNYSEGKLAIPILSSISNLIEANAPLYSSTKGTFTISTGLLNAYFGICLFKINPSNELYIDKMINETGYETYEITSRNILSLKETSIDSTKPFNIIKYDFINLYGDFPQDVCDSLKAILLDGVKVWYSENV